ncbi:MAG TPA: FHA domain-containing protein [Polyangia bacterium]
MVTLLLTEKGGETKQLSFEKDEITIGRVQGNDIVLPKGNVSKRHCKIVSHGGKFSVEDLKSTNGTYINGRKILESTPVVGTDKIYVGDFVVRVDLPLEQLSGPNATAAPAAEAGSLSTALPRRPPPPPGRSTASLPAAAHDDEPEARGRNARTAPPPPPPRRENPSGLDSINTLPPETSQAPELPALGDPEEELLAARPRLTVPPLKSPRPLLSQPAASEGRTLDDEELTGHLDRKPSPAARPSEPRPAPASLEGAAAWLQNLLERDGTSAVYVTGNTVEVERHGQRESVPAPGGATGAGLADAIRSLAARGTPRPSGDTRVVNVLLPENARLAAIFPPVAADLCATLERVTPTGRTLSQLAIGGGLSAEAEAVINACIAARRNILIGGDGRALDAFLQAIAAAIPERMRVVAIADIAAPATGVSWTKLSRDTHVSDVVRAASSLRPDYLIVDVSAPALAVDVLSQSVLGQEGTIVAVAARSASDALERLATLAGPALGGVSHARGLAAAAFDLVACAATLADGTVRLLDLGEPRGDGAASGDVASAIVWQPEAGGGGHFEMVGTLNRLGATLAARGLDLPADLQR